MDREAIREKVKELIKKHIEGWDEPKCASIDYFAETGKVSGNLFVALWDMMNEYHSFLSTHPIENERESIFGKECENDRCVYNVVSTCRDRKIGHKCKVRIFTNLTNKQ